ncbi:hypothetical protein DYB32_005507 [Aphanomyces invadans]|uniref:Uncharacterized protein n=1 Tax=Aphanomyces invadans TaxID=157072 RepID=A0A418AUD8_9STRA|nr:hypothetical protein DYB32_005507 [Aphanomyces invadans]
MSTQCRHYREEAESLANQVMAWKAKHDAVAALLEESIEALHVQGQALNREGMVNEDNRDHLALMHVALASVTFDKHLLAEKYWAMQELVAVAQDESTSHLCKGKIQQLKVKLAAMQQSSSVRRMEGVGHSLARGVLQCKPSMLNHMYRPFATSIGDEVHLDDVANAWQWLNQHMSFKNSEPVG